MDAGRVNGMHCADAGDQGWHNWPGQFMNKLAERRVFLRWAADRGERPDRARAVVNLVNAQHRKIMRERIVAQVIAEGAFGQLSIRVDRPADAKIGLSRN